MSAAGNGPPQEGSLLLDDQLRSPSARPPERSPPAAGCYRPLLDELGLT
ncbi:hypothetical protein RB628_32490 [Streptomyces sp. ADMS]|nr:hypothetical protein [Streptomyces sp. ADMS]MDW4909925.1 hypothetical protein [Streptomyces sp. ADMS]